MGHSYLSHTLSFFTASVKLSLIHAPGHFAPLLMSLARAEQLLDLQVVVVGSG